MSMGIPFIVVLILVTGGRTEPNCPSCEDWAGDPSPICVTESNSKTGTDFKSYCAAFNHYCQSESITNTENDVNKIDFEGILGQMSFLTITDGECPEEEKVCPNSCHSIETNEAVPVCGKDYINYPTSCSLAKKLCESNGIEGFTLVELKEFSDSDFALRIKNHISWRGNCKGASETQDSESTLVTRIWGDTFSMVSRYIVKDISHEPFNLIE
ncbi:hypothetical protein ACHWQZ_G000629 [Mnemiopsis leidyi]